VKLVLSGRRLKEEAEPTGSRQLFDRTPALGDRLHDFTQLYNDIGKYNIDHGKKLYSHPLWLWKGEN